MDVFLLGDLLQHPANHLNSTDLCGNLPKYAHTLLPIPKPFKLRKNLKTSKSILFFVRSLQEAGALLV